MSEYRMSKYFWKCIQNLLKSFLVTVITFIAGSTMRGDSLLIFVHFFRSMQSLSNNETNLNVNGDHDLPVISLERYRLQGLSFFLIMNLTFSYTVYFLTCGFLQWYFYIRQSDQPEKWKCQPRKLMPYDLERREIIIGTLNIGLGSIIFGTLACYIFNGGYTRLYFRLDEYSWTWFFTSIPILFIYQDAAWYYMHRLMHTPLLYRHFHKWHHMYKQPTAFAVTAFHPFELIFFQSVLIVPSLVVPLQVFIYVGNLMYIYYYGMIDHSGIKMDAMWPWQPDTVFHDNHHQYFNINFGFNLLFWDKLHNTYRYVDNSMVGKDIQSDPAAFRTDEETELLERLYIAGDMVNKDKRK